MRSSNGIGCALKAFLFSNEQEKGKTRSHFFFI